jgi:Uma2 family endonuclease
MQAEQLDITRLAYVMLDQDVLLISGKVVAVNVPYEDYLSGMYGKHVEWVYGAVIKMSPVSTQHDSLNRFVEMLFSAYIEQTGEGRVFQDPMVMKPLEYLPGRQPDLQVVLPDRFHLIKKNQVAGAANLVVEIVSPESSSRDRGEKYEEYEKGGVAEYWLLDPIREEALFYVLGRDGKFHLKLPVEGIYTSSVLPMLRLKVDLLWQEKLPGMRETLDMVEAMFEGEK